MALSSEEKEALAAHYRGKDLYNPAEEPGQEPPSFSEGGACGAPGYAEGGDVSGINLGGPLPFGESEFSGPDVSAGTDTVKAPLSAPPVAPALKMTDLGLSAPPMLPPGAPAAVPKPAGTVAAAPPASPAPQNAPAAAGGGLGGLSKSEFGQLMQYLQPSAGQRIGQAAFSGLAGLADAIETGVARTNGSNFQKNIEESRQKQKENLLNALKAKYETKYKGQELALGQERLHEEARQHDLEAGQRKDTLKFEQGKEAREAGQVGAKAQVDAAQKIIEAYEKGSAIGSALGMSERPSSAEYNAAKNVIKSTGAVSGMGPSTVRIKDSGGRMHDLPAASLPAARKRDPGLQVVP